MRGRIDSIDRSPRRPSCPTIQIWALASPPTRVQRRGPRIDHRTSRQARGTPQRQLRPHPSPRGRIGGLRVVGVLSSTRTELPRGASRRRRGQGRLTWKVDRRLGAGHSMGERLQDQLSLPAPKEEEPRRPWIVRLLRLLIATRT